MLMISIDLENNMDFLGRFTLFWFLSLCITSQARHVSKREVDLLADPTSNVEALRTPQKYIIEPVQTLTPKVSDDSESPPYDAVDFEADAVSVNEIEIKKELPNLEQVKAIDLKASKKASAANEKKVETKLEEENLISTNTENIQKNPSKSSTKEEENTDSGEKKVKTKQKEENLIFQDTENNLRNPDNLKAPLASSSVSRVSEKEVRNTDISDLSEKKVETKLAKENLISQDTKSTPKNPENLISSSSVFNASIKEEKNAEKSAPIEKNVETKQEKENQISHTTENIPKTSENLITPLASSSISSVSKQEEKNTEISAPTKKNVETKQEEQNQTPPDTEHILKTPENLIAPLASTSASNESIKEELPKPINLETEVESFSSSSNSEKNKIPEKILKVKIKHEGTKNKSNNLKSLAINEEDSEETEDTNGENFIILDENDSYEAEEALEHATDEENGLSSEDVTPTKPEKPNHKEENFDKEPPKASEHEITGSEKETHTDENNVDNKESVNGFHDSEVENLEILPTKEEPSKDSEHEITDSEEEIQTEEINVDDKESLTIAPSSEVENNESQTSEHPIKTNKNPESIKETSNKVSVTPESSANSNKDSVKPQLPIETANDNQATQTNKGPKENEPGTTTKPEKPPTNKPLNNKNKQQSTSAPPTTLKPKAPTTLKPENPTANPTEPTQPPRPQRPNRPIRPNRRPTRRPTRRPAATAVTTETNTTQPSTPNQRPPLAWFPNFPSTPLIPTIFLNPFNTTNSSTNQTQSTFGFGIFAVPWNWRPNFTNFLPNRFIETRPQAQATPLETRDLAFWNALFHRDYTATSKQSSVKVDETQAVPSATSQHWRPFKNIKASEFLKFPKFTETDTQNSTIPANTQVLHLYFPLKVPFQPHIVQTSEKTKRSETDIEKVSNKLETNFVRSTPLEETEAGKESAKELNAKPKPQLNKIKQVYQVKGKEKGSLMLEVELPKPVVQIVNGLMDQLVLKRN